MVKSDAGVFGLRILGNIIAVIGGLTGISYLLAERTTLGLIILILSLVGGRFLVWKAKRRRGHIIYGGGRI